MKTFTKQPSEILDYDIVFSDWLTAGDNVTGSIVTAEQGINYDKQFISDDRIKIWLSGGTSGTSYKITVLITTEDGRSKEIDFKVKVREI